MQDEADWIFADLWDGDEDERYRDCIDGDEEGPDEGWKTVTGGVEVVVWAVAFPDMFGLSIVVMW